MSNSSTNHDPSKSSRSSSSLRRLLANLIQRGAGKPNLNPGIAEQRRVLRYQRSPNLSQNPPEVAYCEWCKGGYGRETGYEFWDESVGDTVRSY
jgi:hypothetical protein